MCNLFLTNILKIIKCKYNHDIYCSVLQKCKIKKISYISTTSVQLTNYFYILKNKVYISYHFAILHFFTFLFLIRLTE